MKPKDKSEFEALTATEDRAKWLLRKGVTSKITILTAGGRVCYGAYSAGVMLPGEFETREEAIAQGTAFLAKSAGLA